LLEDHAEKDSIPDKISSPEATRLHTQAPQPFEAGFLDQKRRAFPETSDELKTTANSHHHFCR